eukprot:757443-Hanusia_phi.AAC.3
MRRFTSWRLLRASEEVSEGMNQVRRGSCTCSLTTLEMVDELNKANDRVIAFTAERDAAFAQVA